MGRLLQRAKSAPTAHASQAQQSFDALITTLEAVDSRDRVQPNVDLQDAALATLALAERIAAPAFAERIAKQVRAGEVAEDLVERARSYAWASIHIRRKLVLATETRTEAKVAPMLVAEADELLRRMRKLTEYHFDDDPELGPVLAELRLGSGHLDRANDLEEYADIYREKRAVLRADTRHFRATDEADARRVAAEIYQALGVAPRDGDRDWTGLQGAAWPSLLRLFNELRRVGVYLSGGDESGFATLVTAARAARRVAAERAEEEPVPDEDPKPA
jgi:hypothetical protein